MPYKSDYIKLPKELDRRVKLFEEEKESIKNLYKSGRFSYKDLAKKFKVSKSYIGIIVNEQRARKIKEYQKENWRKFAETKEQRRLTMRKYRRYKRKLFLEGRLVENEQ